MNDKRSLIRYSQRSSERACMVCRISTLSMNTQSYGSRPPFDRSARGTAASRSERKISKLTKLLMRSRSSPLADNSRKRSSMSKNPAIRPAMSALPFEDHGLNQASTDSAIVFGGVQPQANAYIRNAALQRAFRSGEKVLEGFGHLTSFKGALPWESLH